ncbi:MAG: hypothetical protein M1818_000426 [Claussenomyces sp. TS43310]|nr:MAG: hypothetical protein M1818_000426 [Claussenomyces sp. TS43310]
MKTKAAEVAKTTKLKSVPVPKSKAAAAPAAMKKGAKRSAAEVQDEPKAKKTKTSTASKAPPIKPKSGTKAKAPIVAKKEVAAKAEQTSDEEDEVEEAPKTVTAPPRRKVPTKPAAPAKKPKFGPAINQVPTKKLDIYVFGEGTSGELGLGSKAVNNKKPIDVKRPRLNENLSATKVGVVFIAVGGMHCAALTHDNKILTWGVNDQGALGRDTKWEGGLKDADDAQSDASGDSDDSDTAMNPMESTPMAVDSAHFPEGTQFVQLAASDSATFALTVDGQVYGWGTFRSNDGILGFTENTHVQYTPIKLPELKKIVSLSAGSNHVLALNDKGKAFAWGSGQQNQLGRRVIERTRTAGLVPREFGLRGKIDMIACGSYHSFAIDKKGQVWAWGLNSFGETGVSEGMGDDNAYVMKPTVVEALGDYDIGEISGGGHHSLACTTDGKLLVWGRCDGGQTGLDIEKLTSEDKENLVFDERKQPRIVKNPTIVPGIQATSVNAGSDNSFAINTQGRVYSWGFSANYQTGQGTDDDVMIATIIDNTAIRDKKIVGAGAGGQFGVLWSVAAEQ